MPNLGDRMSQPMEAREATIAELRTVFPDDQIQLMADTGQLSNEQFDAWLAEREAPEPPPFPDRA